MLLEVNGEELLSLSYPVGRGPDLSLLTPAEREVASLVLDGLSNAAIARRRSTAVRTIANQVGSLLRKLDLSSRCELAALGAHQADS